MSFSFISYFFLDFACFYRFSSFLFFFGPTHLNSTIPFYLHEFDSIVVLCLVLTSHIGIYIAIAHESSREKSARELRCDSVCVSARVHNEIDDCMRWIYIFVYAAYVRNGNTYIRPNLQWKVERKPECHHVF